MGASGPGAEDTWHQEQSNPHHNALESHSPVCRFHVCGCCCALVTTGHHGLGYNQISRTADDKLDTGRVLGTRDHWPLGRSNFDIDTVMNTTIFGNDNFGTFLLHAQCTELTLP